MKSVFSVILMTVLAAPAFAGDPLKGLPDTVARLHKSLIETQQCEADLDRETETHALGQDYTLYLVPCLMGAYQGSSRAYITSKSSFVHQVSVLVHFEKSVQGSLELSEVEFNPKTMQLTTFAKGRGLGDCGQSSVSKIVFTQYGGLYVKTTEIRSKEKCDGKYGAWPVVFRQK